MMSTSTTVVSIIGSVAPTRCSDGTDSPRMLWERHALVMDRQRACLVIRTTIQVAGSLNYTAGSHAIRTGVDLRRIMFYAGSNTRETLRFSGTWTGNAFGDFLLGLPSQTTRDPSDSFQYHIAGSYNWFVQDDY